MPKCNRDNEIQGMKVMSSPRVALPVTAPRLNDDTALLDYTPDDTVQAHRKRPPSWELPQNSVELSKMWLFSRQPIHQAYVRNKT